MQRVSARSVSLALLLSVVCSTSAVSCGEERDSVGPVFGTVTSPTFGVANAVVLQSESFDESVPLSAEGAFAVGSVPSGRYRVTLEFHGDDSRSFEGAVDIEEDKRVLRIELDDDESLRVDAADESDAVPRGSSALKVLGVFADEDVYGDDFAVQVRVLDARADLVFSGTIDGEGSWVATAFLPPGTYKAEVEMTSDPQAASSSCEREVEVTAEPLLIQAIAQEGTCHIFDNSVGK